MYMQFRQAWYAPVFSSLLSDRRELSFIAGAGLLHVGLSLAGLTLWNCPIRAATGVPCPGCGLTRASLEILRGDFSASFQTHAFALFVLGALSLMLFSLFMPEIWRTGLISWIRGFESRFGITAWFMALLFLYWFIRLLGFPPFPVNF